MGGRRDPGFRRAEPGYPSPRAGYNRRGRPAMSRTVTIPIAGMTCDHCVGTVRRALEGVPGVESASVDLQHGKADVTLDPPADESRLRSAVESAGYRVSSEPRPPSPVS